jgi:hypothetical protein
MGGYESKVADHSSANKPNFSDSTAVPAKVMFSPELLHQLQREQEERLHQQRLNLPRQTTLPEEPDAIERERHSRFESQRRAMAARAEERAALRKAEDEASNSAKEVLLRMDKRMEVTTAQKTLQGQTLEDVCREEAARLTKLMDSGKLDNLFAELDVYESCIKKATKVSS